MPYLGDYIGHILSEIVIARAQADLESIRIAETYASHPLLKYFSVPHFTLPTLSMDIPFVVQEMEESEKGDPPRGKIDFKELRAVFSKQLDILAKESDIVLAANSKKEISRKIDQFLSEQQLLIESSISVRHLADSMAKTVILELRSVDEGRDLKQSGKLTSFEMKLKNTLFINFLTLRKSPPRLRVLVTNKELREAGPIELLPSIHLSISEDAVEWTVIEKDDESVDRLVPE